MDIDTGLNDFTENFINDVVSRSQIDDDFIENKFTEIFTDYLTESAEIEDVIVCFEKKKGIKVNGYSINIDENRLDLFITIYKGEIPSTKILKSEIDTNFKWVIAYLKKALEGYHFSLEESSPIFDMSSEIYNLRGKLRNVRFFLITDGIANLDATEDIQDGTLNISKHLWDIRRLYRLKSSGNHREPIEIDFEKDFEGSIFCLPMPKENPVYTSYLAILPGTTLLKIYHKYGSRLLERNVRSFLQVKGNVNKGIRKTILEEPYMFLAYNNGLSATAESVILDNVANGSYSIKYVKDFQIVNGGQTTASIYNAHIKDKADASDIFVPIKLTVLKDSGMIDSFVPKISACANSQNKINVADFSANNPFHIQLEALSRTIWAPPLKGMQLQTRWYYERARGQYLDEKEIRRSTLDKKAFEAEYPTAQKFTKTDMAKFENSWNQLPYIVSRGAEKNFNEFMINLKEPGEFIPDRRYYEHLISKAIFFKQTEKIVQKQHYGGYRANIVTYTIGLISNKTDKRIDLNRIWKEQSLTPALIETIIKISYEVHKYITTTSEGKNVTEWCKKKQCWKNLLELPLNISDELIIELADTNQDIFMEITKQVLEEEPEDADV